MERGGGEERLSNCNAHRAKEDEAAAAPAAPAAPAGFAHSSPARRGGQLAELLPVRMQRCAPRWDVNAVVFLVGWAVVEVGRVYASSLAFVFASVSRENSSEKESTARQKSA